MQKMEQIEQDNDKYLKITIELDEVIGRTGPTSWETILHPSSSDRTLSRAERGMSCEPYTVAVGDFNQQEQPRESSVPFSGPGPASRSVLEASSRCRNRFIQIMIKPISDGETPEIREAWPNVVGRIFSSFCLASTPKLLISA